MEMKNHKQQHTAKEHDKHYKHLLIMAILSFFAMYVLMYAMVDAFSNVFMNVNQFYMAGLMASPMVIIELLVMRGMYRNKKLNMLLMGVSLILLVGFFALIRLQVGVSDKQFLKSMIPHHAGAILMCEEANITDPEIKKLCEQIRVSQEKEIAQMKTKLSELKSK
jgi:uncharacterized protein (DUF305 family)